MNCAQLASATGWDCQAVGEHTLRVHSPATLSGDGEHISFYLLNEGSDRFFLTDGHATADNLTSRGVRLNPNRLKAMQKIPGNHLAELTSDWEIVASGDLRQLRPALWEATSLAVTLASKVEAWQPRSHQERFSTLIQKSMARVVGVEKIIAKFKIEGSSGHQLEFPFGIARDRFVQAVQPIGLDDEGRPDWGFVYQCFGKLSDLKERSDPQASNRLVILQAADSEDWKQAVSLLAGSAQVIPYRTFEDLAVAA